MERFFLIFALLAPAACREDRIETRRVPKEESAPLLAGGDAAPAARRRPHWTAPKGWTERPGDGLRAATFALPQDAGKAEVTVIALPGDVGGELANVNRWRGQISLPPLTEAQLDGARERVRCALGPVWMYDFTGAGDKKTRIVAGMIQVSGTTWFFKLMGDARAVGAAKPAFVKLLESLKSDAA